MKTTLYIATHNTTGLKYFGKTTKYFTQEDLQKNYHGSGVYWKNHLRKHGDDVTMDIYGIYSLEEVSKIALNFSIENNITESNTWANLVDENGLDGGVLGTKLSEKQKKQISSNMRGKVAVKDKKGKFFQVSKEEFESNNYEGVNKGKILTDEHKAKISPVGRTLSDETKRKIGDKHKGKIVSEETKQKLRDRKFTDEWKNNISEAAKNRPKVTCPHCDKVGDTSNMKRWHFDNCNLKV